MHSRPVISVPSTPSPDPMGEDLQKLLTGLAGFVHCVLEHPPSEPLADLHYRDISAGEWRRALRNWADSSFTRRVHASEWLAGLRLGLDELSDSAVLELVKDLDR